MSFAGFQLEKIYYMYIYGKFFFDSFNPFSVNTIVLLL